MELVEQMPALDAQPTTTFLLLAEWLLRLNLLPT